MQLTTVILAALAAVTSAAPSNYFCNNIDPTKPFHLSIQHPRTPDSHGPYQQPISIFDPNYQDKFVLRTVERGSGTASKFKFSNGRLTFRSTAPHGVGPTLTFRALDVVEGEQFHFGSGKAGESRGSFNMIDTDIGHQGDAGCVLTVGHGLKVEGFTICDGQFGERVISWKNHSEAKNCKPIHIVASQ